MPTLVVVGLQWGDEGKGKVVDLLAQEAEVVARYQGGPNAGHTVRFDGQGFICHQIPVGIFSPRAVSLIGGGCVIDPGVLKEELEGVEGLGYGVESRLFIDRRAHLIMPYHKLLDRLRDERAGMRRIGTTHRGIGNCYGDKYTRTGIRVGDLLNPSWFEERLKGNLLEKNFILKEFYEVEPLSCSEILEEYLGYREWLIPMLVEGSGFLLNRIRAGERVLAEGAQGTLLDIDYGTYPYVTSSSPSAGGACVGLGISPGLIDRIWGVAKAYTTRVGMGPFPTEAEPEVAEQMRRLGDEFGRTTQRPRRCGWFDAPLVRYAARLNGIDGLIITKLDVLDQFPRLKFGIGYTYRGEELDEFSPEIAAELEPRYLELEGWQTPTTGIRRFENLPRQAQKYLLQIEAAVGVEVVAVSVGEDRRANIIREGFKPFG